jgi:hypothetical protein
VLKSRRGLLAAGLAVVVAGAIGVASILNAGAEQIPGAAPQPAAAAASSTPPALLPWGQRPQKIKRGKAGASSKTLHAEGLAAAPDDTSGSTQPRGRYAPKGIGDGNPVAPEPPGAAQPSDDPVIPGAPAPSESESDAPPLGDPPLGDPPVLPTSTGTTAAATTDPTASASSGDGTVAPEPIPSASASSSGPYFLYSGAKQDAVTTGFYATLTIAKPTLASGDYHTLAELSLQDSASAQQTVEIGWNVDRAVNGDDDPHLFVYHWINGAQTCYNGCGFVQYSSTIKPGDTLATGAKKFSIQYSGNAWWVAFDTEWVGYFPESLWINAGVSSFAVSGRVQLFGEVASPTTKPTTQMGNGYDSSCSTAAVFASTTFLNGPTVSLIYDEKTVNNTIYTLFMGSTLRSFRYGGTTTCPTS